MSVDYWSACVACSSRRASELVERLVRKQRCGALIGPDEETFVHAWRGARELDVDELGQRYGGQPPPRLYWENASVELPEEDLDFIPDDVVMTNRSSALSALDRVLALPHGLDLVRGHALVHVPHGGLAQLEEQLAAVYERAGGRASAIRTLQQYLHGNANEGCAAALIAALDASLLRAKKKRLDLVLLSATPP